MATGRLAQYIAASLLHILAAIGMPACSRSLCASKQESLRLDFRGVFTLPSASGVPWRYRFFPNPPSLFVSIALLSSADFSADSPLPYSLAPLYGSGWEGDHQLQRSSVKLACHHQTASDTSQEHEMCSSVPIHFPCICIGRFRRLAPALPDQDSAPV